MKNNLAIILLAVFLFSTGVGAFGLQMMDHSSSHHCPVAMLDGECPQSGAMLALHHLLGMKDMTLAYVVAIFFVIGFSLSYFTVAPSTHRTERGEQVVQIESHPLRLIYFWSALLNKCDPLSLLRVQRTAA